MKIRRSSILSLFLIAAGMGFLFLQGIQIPYLDKNTDTYFNQSIQKASIAYGICRVINASVSVIKESEIQIEPAGMGVSLAAGQILDPLDDLTERTSDILVTAIVSLGIQKIVYELCVDFAPLLFGIALLFFGLALFFKGDKASALQGILIKAILLVAIARLCLPISSLLNTQLNAFYFSPKIDAVKKELSLNSPAMEKLKDMSMPEIDGVLGTIQNGFGFVKEKTSELRESLKWMIQNSGNLVANLLNLSYLYVSVFIVQVILLPVGMFWMLSRVGTLVFAKPNQ